MGRSPCCDKVGLKKGPWTPEEDQKLLAYIQEHGHGSWRALPAKAGLQRCGKSCRLRWTNYLRPDIKRGKFSLQEEQTIIQLHALLGNRWSAIATHLAKRTDNEIKNYWNTHLKKRLTKMGIDPVTHKPKNDALLSIEGHSKTAANLSHMAQWESARLEAEARLVRESKLRSHSLHLASSSTTFVPSSSSSSSSALAMTKPSSLTKDWSNNSNGGWLKSNEGANGGIAAAAAATTGISSGELIESPTSTLSFSAENNAPPIMSTSGENNNNNNTMHMIEFVGTTNAAATTATTNSGSSENDNDKNGRIVKEELGDHHHHQEEEEWKAGYDEDDGYKEDDVMENSMHFNSTVLHDDDDEELRMTMETTWGCSHHDDLSLRTSVAEEGFTNLLLNADSNELSLSSEGGAGSGDSNNNNNNNNKDCEGGNGSGSDDCFEDNKNYWNSILNLVNSSPSDSPIF